MKIVDSTANKHLLDDTIHNLFDKQAELIPNDIAVIFEGRQLTYGELKQKSDAIANSLKINGAAAGDIVALMITRSELIPAGILGILKAGCICLPIDITYPKSYWLYMLSNSGTKYILKNKNMDFALYETIKAINIEEAENAELTGKHKDDGVGPDSPAYIIYTSGSTGYPKGVVLKHKGIINHAYTKIDLLNIDKSSVVCQNLSVSFVASIWQVVAPLISGARIVIYRQEIAADLHMLFEKGEKDGVTILEIVPSLLKTYLRLLEEGKEKVNLSHLKVLVLTGEKVLPELVNKFYEKYNIPLVNAYGQSECSDDTLHYKIPYNTNTLTVPIGKPSYNTSVYILDSNMKQLPVNEWGEICISGVGVCEGYLNNNELSRKKFIDNPFEPGKIMFRTGDIGRWTDDGNVELLGRNDNQVKINGHRIELEEIEYHLQKNDYIKDAAVICRTDDKGDSYICAYVSTENGESIKKIKKHLSKSLPAYMIPKRFIRIAEIPRTPNGKIDRKALDEIKGKELIHVKSKRVRNETEKRLTELWIESLGVEQIDPQDSFFSVGGDSLKAVTLAYRINKEFDTNITLQNIIKHPTVRKLAEFIDRGKRKKYKPIMPATKKEYYQLSYAQRRMFFANQLVENQTNYNISGFILVEGKIDKEKLEQTFNKLIQRHESLRTSFRVINGEPVQFIHDEIEFKINYINLGNDNNEGANANICGDRLDDIIDGFVQPFDLSKAPLIRVGLVKISEDRHLLMYDMHHIISDGFSLAVLIREFISLYNGEELPEIKIQYKDFSEWHNNYLKSSYVKKQENYWLQVFKNNIPTLNLPLDYARPPKLDFRGDCLKFEIDSNTFMSIKQFIQEKQITLFVFLTSVLNVLLALASGQEDIVIGTPAAGRRHADLENTIGVFVNTVALRNYPKFNKVFSDFLEEVARNTFKAFDNQDYQFEMLLDKLELKRDNNRNPLFDVLIDSQRAFGEVQLADGLKLVEFEHTKKTTTFDLTLYFYEYDNKLVFNCTYRTSLFKGATIKYLFEEFQKLIKEIIRNPYARIKDYNIFKRNGLIEKNKAIIHIKHEEFIKDYTFQSIAECFDKCALMNCDRLAVKSKNIAYTYGQLNKESSFIAAAIRDKIKLKQQDKESDQKICVATLLGHDAVMIKGILGVLKSGSIFVPLDPTYPVERLKYIIKDSGTNLILTDNQYIQLAETLISQMSGSVEILTIESIEPTEPLSNIELQIDPYSTAFILYTSGSTGRPKGIYHNHFSFLNMIRIYINTLKINCEDRVALFTSYSHAVGLIDIFSTLLCGGTVYTYNIKESGNITRLPQWLRDEGITVYHSVPTLYRHFVASLESGSEFPQLRLVILGGEEVLKNDFELYKKHFSDKCLFVNFLGASEVLVATFNILDKDSEVSGNTVPVGFPVEEMEILIIKDGREARVFEEGEIYYNSPYLAKGYWEMKQKTEESFVKNPLSGKGTVFKSGDLGRVLPDAKIEYLGRIDYQVKINGFRVELGEVEARLLEHPDIKEVSVVAKSGRENTKYLCAYYTSDVQLSSDGLRDYLSMELPEFMIPKHFIQLDALPLTPNGKVDRNLLVTMAIETVSIDDDQRTPNEIEDDLINIWKRVLKIENIGLTDSFFDLGGNSLKLMEVYEHIASKYSIEITLPDLFAFTTVKRLAEYIKNSLLKQCRPFIKAIEFPASYFFGGISKTSQTALSFKINNNTCDEIYKISNRLGIKTTDIIVALFIYLISEITQKEEIYVQTVTDLFDTVASIGINLRSVDNIGDLALCTMHERNNALKNRTYKVSDSPDLMLAKRNREIIPLVCDRKLLSTTTGLTNYFDIVLLYETEEDGIHFKLEFNRNLRTEKMKEFLHGYAKIFDLFISSLNT